MADEWLKKIFSKNFPTDMLYIQHSTFFEKSTIGVDIWPFTHFINLIFLNFGPKNGIYQQIEIFFDKFILFKQHFGGKHPRAIVFHPQEQKG